MDHVAGHSVDRFRDICRHDLEGVAANGGGCIRSGPADPDQGQPSGGALTCSWDLVLSMRGRRAGLESSNDGSELARGGSANVKEFPEFIFGNPTQISHAAVAITDQRIHKLLICQDT